MAVTWLHISDFHIRSGDPYDRDVVLRALVQAVAEYRARGRRPDVIFATGDIAQSGRAAEYLLGSTFFDDLLAAANLPKNRLFIIPGNHDVDRDLGEGLARTLVSRENSDRYFQPERPKPHLTQKLRAYLDWHNQYFAGIRTASESSTCGPVELLEINGARLGILPINSALFCQDENDHDKLWVGRRCLDAALAQLRALDADRNIVLIHHPLDWLCAIEGSNIQSALEPNAHILLRGHLHETRIESVVSPEGALLRCAAGAAYQSRLWPNRALYGTFDGDRLTIFPIRYEDAPREIWTTDPSVFPRDEGHARTFTLRSDGSDGKPLAPPPPRPVPQASFRGNIPARGSRPFVGRSNELAQLAAILADPAQENVAVLHGPPGVGKSELAREFARLHHDRYPGGTFFVDASTNAIAIHLARLGQVMLELVYAPGLPLDDQGLQAFQRLGSSPVLLLYDNVLSYEQIAPWLPLAHMPCHALVTTLADMQGERWPCVEISPLSHPESLELVDKLTGGKLPRQYSEAIARNSGGFPVQLIPDATTLAKEQRRNRLDSVPLAPVAVAGGDSFRAAYNRLDQPERLLLHTAALLNPQLIPAAELEQHLTGGLDWTLPMVRRTLDVCLDLHLLDDKPNLRMHQLFATFLRATLLSEEEQAALSRVRNVQAQRFVELAEAVRANPADTRSIAALLNYPLTLQAWGDAGIPLSGDQSSWAANALWEIGRFDESLPWYEHAVKEAEQKDEQGNINHALLGIRLNNTGSSLSSAGKYQEALPWLQRAVAAKELGDDNGRIDHDSLGASLLEVGHCLASTGEYDEARSWYDRAVAEKEQGDVQGRVDHLSLGGSLLGVGYCLSRTSKFEDACIWFERSITEMKQGNVHGRIDHDRLGAGLHHLGVCLSSTDKHREARSWFERAVTETEQGDVHGRIDHENLGVSLDWVAYCLTRAEEYAPALTWYERSIAEKRQGNIHGRVDNASLATTLRNTAACLRELGGHLRAEQLEQEASELGPAPDGF